MLESIKKYKIYYTVSIIVVIISLLGFAYAYFENSITNEFNFSSDVGFEENYKFETSGNTAVINATIDAVSMYQGMEDTVVYENPQNITVQLINNDTMDITCTYDLIWKWNSSGYALSSGATNEFTITIDEEDEVQLPNYSTASNVVYSGVIRTVALETNSIIHNATLKFYNLVDVDQSIHAGQTYSGSLKIENVVCQRAAVLSEMIVAQISEDDYISSQDSSQYRVIEQNGVRYEGKNPDNYVIFDDEIWRIIGAFEGSTIGLESGKYYTKLLKDVSLGDIAWDTSKSNVWRTSSLYSYLTGTYLPSLSSDYLDMIVTARWYLGGNDEYGISASDFYTLERGSVGANGTTAAEDLTLDSKIGLMYISDYGYAMYGGTASTACRNESVGLTSFNSSSACKNYDWIYTGVAKNAINSVSNHAQRAVAVAANGNIGYSTVSVLRAEHPAIYISSDVLAILGDGSSANPFIISMPQE